MGTPSQIWNGTGSAIAGHFYYPYGQELVQSTDTEVMRFTGHERDLNDPAGPEDDLDYMHARHYGPMTGRFLSTDRLFGDLGSPQTLNKFAYVAGNPVSFTDPSGRFGEALFDIASRVRTQLFTFEMTTTTLESADRLSPKAASTPATPIENPRQLPAWRYSERFGPAPPCFARAGRMPLPDGRVAMFIGGTASVRGEDSFAPDDLEQQIAETLRNLDAVIEAGLGPVAGGGARCLVEARAYCLRAADISAVQAAAMARFAGLERLEICQADICRRELRVEIEGLVVAERRSDGARAVPEAVSVLRAGLG